MLELAHDSRGQTWCLRVAESFYQHGLCARARSPCRLKSVSRLDTEHRQLLKTRELACCDLLAIV